MKKRITVLGSTGSVGSQALEVISTYPGLYELKAIAGGENVPLLVSQARKYRPSAVAIANKDKYHKLKGALNGLPIEVKAGSDAVAELAGWDETDLVVSSMVGYAGLQPALTAISAGKQLALANKETLVVAGELVLRLARERNVKIIPVDSEHSAIFQCLTGEEHSAVEKIILTASGGPFYGKDKTFLDNVTLEQALNHPNWSMGEKITIDSASLMNKGLEAIEARWLFGLEPSQIEVVIHPQSVIHSMVQFIDGSVKAQLSVPDMRFPILYALSYPHRLPSTYTRIDFNSSLELSFRQPDLSNFPNLAIALECMRKGGNMPCVMNAANELAVEAFRKKRLRFMQIPVVIEKTLTRSGFIEKPEYEDYVRTDEEARNLAASIIRDLQL